MKNASRKIILSVLTLVLTIIALGTTTFAWFSLSTVSNVSNIKGQVRSGDGLEIQLTATKNTVSAETPWKSNLSQEDVAGLIDKIYANERLTAVSGTTFGTFRKSGMSDDGKMVIDKDPAVANQDYIVFTVNFRSEEAGTVDLTNLTFNLGTALKFTTDGSAYLQAPSATGKGEVETHAAYGARVAFGDVVFQYGTKDSVPTATTVGDGEEAVTTISGNTFMGDKGVEYGQYSFLTTSKGLELYKTGDGSVLTQITDATSESLLPAFGNEDLIDETNEDTPRVSAMLTKNQDAAYATGSILVTIWLEGWDADTYDSLYKGELDISMTFKKREA